MKSLDLFNALRVKGTCLLGIQLNEKASARNSGRILPASASGRLRNPIRARTFAEF
jgi:hypothetical protein